VPLNLLRRRLAASFQATFGGLSAPYWTLWLGTLINRLGGFVAPFLGLYLTTQRGLPIEQAGLVVSLFGLGSLCASILGGVLADRLGRRTTLLLALLLGSAAMLGVGFAERPAAVAVLTFVLGLTSDMQRPATAAMVADVVSPADRLRAYGLLHWAINIGFSVAPVVAGLLAGISFRLLFVLDAVTSLAYALLVFLRLREPPATHDRRREPVLAGLVTVARDGRFMAFVALTFLVGVIYKQVDVGLAADIGAHGISPRGFGAIVAVNGVLIVLLSPSIASRLSPLPRGPVLAAAAVCTGLGFALHAPAATVLGFIGGVVLWTFGEIASFPASSALVAERAPAHLRGRYQGAFIMSWGAAAFVGPSVGSLVMGRFGADALWLACGLLGVVAAAGFWIVAAGMGVPSPAREVPNGG